jgi:DNA-directed RNA polymerase subunit N (RpoN/RPB10)
MAPTPLKCEGCGKEIGPNWCHFRRRQNRKIVEDTWWHIECFPDPRERKKKRAAAR